MRITRMVGVIYKPADIFSLTLLVTRRAAKSHEKKPSPKPFRSPESRSRRVTRTRARREAAREEAYAAGEVVAWTPPGPPARPARGVALEAVRRGVDHAHDTHVARLHLQGVGFGPGLGFG